MTLREGISDTEPIFPNSHFCKVTDCVRYICSLQTHDSRDSRVCGFEYQPYLNILSYSMKDEHIGRVFRAGRPEESKLSQQLDSDCAAPNQMLLNDSISQVSDIYTRNKKIILKIQDVLVILGVCR